MASAPTTARPALITADDVMDAGCAVLSVFIREPEFQGQTKDKLSSPDAQRLVETVVRDHFDHWLAESPAEADKLLGLRHRLRRGPAEAAAGKGSPRASRRRASCACPASWPTAQGRARTAPRLFLVEGDSAGGSAKQARDRATQAILPLRGKILNVASGRARASCSRTRNCPIWCRRWAAAPARSTDADDLRYDRIIIMTDADVDGAHIASLLITFFYRDDAGADRRRRASIWPCRRSIA